MYLTLRNVLDEWVVHLKHKFIVGDVIDQAMTANVGTANLLVTH